MLIKTSGFKAIVPAAGLGTRMLPFTRSVAKELLPVGTTPAIQLVAEEAAASGASEMVVVCSQDKEAVTQHFQQRPDLVNHLRDSGKAELADTVERIASIIPVSDVIQEEPLGLGHAVLIAEDALGDDDACAVMLPDDLLLPGDVLEKMARIREAFGGSVLCAIEVRPEETSKYGVFAIDDASEEVEGCEVKKVTGMVEKPAPADAPSRLAAAGRYLLDRAVFDALREITPGAGGELQLTDAIDLLIQQGHPVHVLVHGGMRLDVGNPEGFVLANVEMALQNPQLRSGVLEQLQAIVTREQ